MALVENFVIKLYLQCLIHYFAIKWFIFSWLIVLLYINKILIETL
jgi:hypothetical protein